MALSDWAPEIVSLDEAEETLNLLVYAPAGTGKTVFAGSAPRVLFLATEKDGVVSAKRRGSTAKVWPVLNFRQLEEALNKIEDNIDEVKESFDWIVVDSITHMQRMVMRQILDDAVDDNPERDPDLPQLQDYQKYQAWFLRIVQGLNDLPINVLWTALSKTEEDEEGEEFVVPDIQGKGYQMSMTVCSYMTSYGYMKATEKVVKVNGEIKRDEDGEPVKRVSRQIIWRDTGHVRGKDRTDTLAPSTTDLTLAEIAQLISGEETKQSLKQKKAERLAAKRAGTPAKKAAPAKKTEEAPEA